MGLETVDDESREWLLDFAGLDPWPARDSERLLCGGAFARRECGVGFATIAAPGIRPISVGSQHPTEAALWMSGVFLGFVTALTSAHIDEFGYLYPLDGRPEDGYYVEATDRSVSELAMKLATFSDVQAEYADTASAVFEVWTGPLGMYFRGRTANPACDFGARTVPRGFGS